MSLLPKLLVVEDSPSELELMRHYLSNNGYEVMTASAAKEALGIALSQELDAIVTDVVMPGMSGFELCRLLRRNPRTQKSVIIICSSKDLEIDRLWGMRQGANAYITKPYTCENLLNVINNLVSEGDRNRG